MDRKALIGLFQQGMRYPLGKHRLWFCRCFEVTVHPEGIVEVDEYEGAAPSGRRNPDGPRHPGLKEALKGMFHVGRSLLQLPGGRVLEQTGQGWNGSGKKRA
jgi:hypothetical protein